MSNPGPAVTTGSTNVLNAEGPNLIGNSATSKVGFFGTEPVNRPTVTWPNTATATTTLNETKVNRIMAALVTLGLIETT
jgi:hypothetical protein